MSFEMNRRGILKVGGVSALALVLGVAPLSAMDTMTDMKREDRT